MTQSLLTYVTNGIQEFVKLTFDLTCYYNPLKAQRTAATNNITNLLSWMDKPEALYSVLVPQEDTSK